MLKWEIMDISISAAAHTCMQLFFLFKCVGIKEERYRRPCFWLIIIYSMIFYIAEDVIYYLPEYVNSLPLQTAHSLIHAVNTFIMFGICGVCGSGYLPRNFIKAEIYYDLLSTIPVMPMFLVAGILKRIFLPPGTTVYTDYPAGYVITSVCTVIGLFQVIALYYLCGRKIDMLLQKIPDKVCLIFFMLTFFAFVTKEAVLLKTGTYYYANSPDITYMVKCTFLCAVALFYMTILFIIMLLLTTINYRRLQYLQSLENSMLLGYYTSVSALHNSIRSLRHDLSNHLAALSFMENSAPAASQAAMDDADMPGSSGAAASYRSSLLDICDEINAEMKKQISWQQIQTDLLSSREKYELYHCIMTVIKKHRLPESALCISSAAYGNVTEIRFAVREDTAPENEQTSRSRPLHLLTLRHGMLFYMIKTIARAHNGHAVWKRNGSTFMLSLTLPQAN